MGSGGPVWGLGGRGLPGALAVVLVTVLGSNAWIGIDAASASPSPTAAPTPIPATSPLGHELSAAGQQVAQAVSAAVGNTGFPLLLIALVPMFLVAQNLIDRRDLKLALASIGADDMVEFQPPPSRRDW
jgi:hypothetical protein